MNKIEIEYDVSAEESKDAFMCFFRKYRLRQTVLLSIVFLIATGLFINTMIVSLISGAGATASMIGGIGAGLSAGLLANVWLKPRRAAKKLLHALEYMAEEKYTAVFGDTQIEIETLIHTSGSDSDSDNDSEDDGSEKIEKTVLLLSQEELCSQETHELFLLFVNRSLVYVFPKRCLSESEQTNLQEYFTNKNI